MILGKSILDREMQQMLWFWVRNEFGEFKDEEKGSVAER